MIVRRCGRYTGTHPQRSPKGPSLPMALRVTRPTARRPPAPIRAPPRASLLAREDLAALPRAVRRRRAASPDAARAPTRRAARSSRPAWPAPAREAPKAVAHRFATTAGARARRARGRAARAAPPQLRRRRPLRARRAGRGRGAVQGRPAPEPGAARTCATTSRALQTRAAAAASRPQLPADVAAALPRAAPAAPSACADGRPPGRGPDAEPVHDRPRRGGDAAALPRRRARRRRRDHRRRHRLDATARSRSPRRSAPRSSSASGPAPSPTRATSRFDAATGDWIMYLDADEVLVADDAERLRELTGRTWREAFYLVETNFTGDLGDGTARHPQRAARVPQPPRVPLRGPHPRADRPPLPADLPERIEVTDVRVEHYGYLGVVRDAKEKSRRNIELLERQRDEGGEEPGLPALQPRLRVRRAGRERRARCASFERAWELLRERPRASATSASCPSLVGRLVRARRAQRPPRTAPTSWPTRASSCFPGFTDLVFEQALSPREASGRRGRGRRAARALPRDGRRARAATRPRSAAARYLALVALAEVRRAQGDDAAEVGALLARCLDEHPSFLGAVGPYAAALLADGVEPPTVVVDDVARPRRRSSRRACASCSAPRSTRPATPADAEAQFRRRRSPRSPSNAAARVALAEACSRSAAGTRPPRPPPRSTTARRSPPPRAAAELFARDRGRRRPTLRRAARARAPRVDLAAGELAVFDAGARLAAGGDAAVARCRRTAGPAARHRARGAAARRGVRRRRRPLLAAIERLALPRARAPRAAGRRLPAPRLPRVGRRRVDRRLRRARARRRRARRPGAGRLGARACTRTRSCSPARREALDPGHAGRRAASPCASSPALAYRASSSVAGGR